MEERKKSDEWPNSVESGLFLQLRQGGGLMIGGVYSYRVISIGISCQSMHSCP